MEKNKIATAMEEKFMDRECVGEVLRIIRIAKDLSQKDLAPKTSISTSYLCELEKGKKSASPDMLEKILCFYGLNATTFEVLLKYYKTIHLKDRLKKYQLTMLKVLNLL